MEFTIQNINKVYLIIFFLILSDSSLSQTPKSSINILGDWKCVKIDIRGIGKFSLKEIKEIEKSTLHIGTHNYYFKNIHFIEQCSNDKWEIKPFADGEDACRKLEIIYSKAQLKRIYLIEPVDKYGNEACYNECVFFKKGNVLIGNCGGYLFYWVKMRSKLLSKTL